MKRHITEPSFETPSLVPLADMLTNTVGIMMFILALAVLTAGGAVLARTFPIERATVKSRLLFVCVHNRILPLNEDQLKSVLEHEVGVPNADPSWARRVQGARFERNGFRLEGNAEVAGGELLVRANVQISPLPNAGEDPAKAAAPGSAFLAALKQSSPKRQFVFFLVYPDSLDAFETARKAAQKNGYESGWYPKAAGEPIKDVLWSVEHDEGLKIVPQG